MASIKCNGNILNFDFDCVKFIKVNDMLTFYHRCLNGDIQIFDEHDFFKHKSITILPHTKWKDIYSFTKTNVLGKFLVQKYQDSTRSIFNKEAIEKVVNELKRFNNTIDCEHDLDFLKILSLIIDYDIEKNIDKNDLLSLIDLLAENDSETKIVLFNSEIVDNDVVTRLLERNVKTIIVFNEPFKLNDILSKNKNDIIMSKKDIFVNCDFKTSIDEDVNPNSEKIFLKI